MALNAETFPQLSTSRFLRHPVRLTALLYLRDALLQEEYEVCKSFIEIALEFGADIWEIKHLLEDPRRTPSS